MIYEIDGKFYILASGYYREVEVKENPHKSGDFIVVPVKTGKRIEAKENESRTQIHYKEAYKKANKKNYKID